MLICLLRINLKKTVPKAGNLAIVLYQKLRNGRGGSTLSGDKVLEV